MNGRSPLESIAYLKGALEATDGSPAIRLSDDDSPVLRPFAPGLLCSYLWDDGNRFSYVQESHLRAEGCSEATLHASAIENLKRRVDSQMQLQHQGSIWMLTCDGNFEASLLLLDELWEQILREQAGEQPAVAVPARDVLCFCSSTSSAGVERLRDIIERVWDGGDHLVSKRIFKRGAGRWSALDPVQQAP